MQSTFFLQIYIHYLIMGQLPQMTTKIFQFQSVLVSLKLFMFFVT